MRHYDRSHSEPPTKLEAIKQKQCTNARMGGGVKFYFIYLRIAHTRLVLNEQIAFLLISNCTTTVENLLSVRRFFFLFLYGKELRKVYDAVMVIRFGCIDENSVFLVCLYYQFTNKSIH